MRVGRRTIGAHGGVISPADDTGGQDVRADLLCQGRSAAPGSCRRCLHRVIHGVAFRLQRCSCRSARERIRRASERQRRHEADCIIRQSVWRPFRVVRASGRRRTLSGRRRPGRTAAADSLAGCSCAILASSSGEEPMVHIQDSVLSFSTRPLHRGAWVSVRRYRQPGLPVPDRRYLQPRDDGSNRPVVW